MKDRVNGSIGTNSSKKGLVLRSKDFQSPLVIERESKIETRKWFGRREKTEEGSNNRKKKIKILLSPFFLFMYSIERHLSGGFIGRDLGSILGRPIGNQNSAMGLRIPAVRIGGDVKDSERLTPGIERGYSPKMKTRKRRIGNELADTWSEHDISISTFKVRRGGHATC